MVNWMGSMKERILEICREICKRDISADEELIKTGILNSFYIMELVCRLEEEFHTTFLPEEISELDHFSSVDHMVELIFNK